MALGKEYPFLHHRDDSAMKDCYLCSVVYKDLLDEAQRKGLIVPPNFRIFPNIRVSNENSLRDRAKDIFPYFGYSVQDGSLIDVDSYVAWAKNWWENGV